MKLKVHDFLRREKKSMQNNVSYASYVVPLFNKPSISLKANDSSFQNTGFELSLRHREELHCSDTTLIQAETPLVSCSAYPETLTFFSKAKPTTLPLLCLQVPQFQPNICLMTTGSLLWTCMCLFFSNLEYYSWHHQEKELVSALYRHSLIFSQYIRNMQTIEKIHLECIESRY